MKKFLTVLLALSVVFTYTVGTAFAAATPEQVTAFDKAVDKFASDTKDDFDLLCRKTVADLDDGKIDGYDVSKEAFVKGAEAFKEDYYNAVDERANEIKAFYKDPDLQQYYATDRNSMKASFEDINPVYVSKPVTVYGTVNVGVLKRDFNNSDVYKKAALTTAFDELKADILNKLNNYMDVSMYSTTVQEITVNGEVRETSYRALAEEVIADLIEKATLTTIDPTDTTVAKVEDKLSKIKNKVANYVVAKNVGFGYVLTGINYLVTSDDEQDTATDLELAKSEALAKMNTKVAAYLNENKADLAAAKLVTDAYVKAQTYRINNAKSVDGIMPGAVKESYKKIVDRIDELEAFAAKYKLEKDANNNILRDAEKVDAVVEEEKDDAYAYNSGVNDTVWGEAKLNAAKLRILNDCFVAEAKTTYAVEVKKAEIEKKRKEIATEDNYYAPELAKVNALFDELLAQVDAAKDDTAVDNVPTAPSGLKFTTIPEKTTVQNTIETFSAFKADFAELQRYMGGLNHDLNSLDPKYTDFSEYDMGFFADLYAEDGVRANADITADTYALAKAAIDAAKTNKQLAEEKAAVEALIEAIPAILTPADKAAVEAAEKAYTEYKDNKATTVEPENLEKLGLALGKFWLADKTAVTDLQSALPTVLTLADKAAVNEFLAAAKALEATTEDGEIYARVENANEDAEELVDDATTLFKAIRTLDKAAVEALINALPLNITLKDKAAVEAARAAYDAFVTEYLDYEEPYPATVANFRELALAEASIAAAEKVALEEQIAAVKGMKVVKAHSTAGKGYIKVMWDVVGDETAIDGFQVYKSTKAQSGYTFMGKTTKHYMTNKKGLKKGKRFYYKVRAYKVIDGTKYFSDWSNKANRIAK